MYAFNQHAFSVFHFFFHVFSLFLHFFSFILIPNIYGLHQDAAKQASAMTTQLASAADHTSPANRNPTSQQLLQDQLKVRTRCMVVINFQTGYNFLLSYLADPRACRKTQPNHPRQHEQSEQPNYTTELD